MGGLYFLPQNLYKLLVLVGHYAIQVICIHLNTEINLWGLHYYRPIKDIKLIEIKGENGLSYDICWDVRILYLIKQNKKEKIIKGQ